MGGTRPFLSLPQKIAEPVEEVCFLEAQPLTLHYNLLKKKTEQ
jgi:hypothetical protein